MTTPDPGREPSAAAARRTGMRRLTLTLAALTLALAACGDTGDEVATDPPRESSPTASPTPSPGAYPDYAPTDYTYTLVVSCFCPGAGTPIAVTVVGDEVVDATYAEGELAGQQASEPFRLSIDDVIAAANEAEATGAAQVTVDWPDGQAYPTSVYVDRDEQMADEERGLAISDVQAP